MGVIPPQGLGAELIEATTAVVALAGAKRVQVGPNRGRGIVAPDQFVVHPLELVTGNTSCDARYALRPTNYPAARRPPRQRLRSSRSVFSRRGHARIPLFEWSDERQRFCAGLGFPLGRR